MKRLVWLLLAVWCTALAQVQPVAPLPAAAHEECGCGDCAGACGMPDCALPPAPPVTTAIAGRTTTTVARPTARLDAQATATLALKYFTAFVEPAVVPAFVRAPDSMAPPAGVPLFKEHCAFLL